MNAVEHVLDQRKLFDEQVPELLKEHAGDWVLFNEGEVQNFFPTMQAALAEGRRRYGYNAGFLVTDVRRNAPVPMTAAVALFGAAPS